MARVVDVSRAGRGHGHGVMDRVRGEAAAGVMTSGTPSSSATRIFVFTPVVRSTGTIISRQERTSSSKPAGRVRDVSWLSLIHI